MTLVTLMTGDAATNGFDADPKFLRFNSLFVEDISTRPRAVWVQPFLWGEPFTSKTFILIHSLLYFLGKASFAARRLLRVRGKPT